MPTIFKLSDGWIDLDTGRHYFLEGDEILISGANGKEEDGISDPDDVARLTATLDKMAEAHWANDPTQAKQSKLDPEWIGANDKERQLYEVAIAYLNRNCGTNAARNEDWRTYDAISKIFGKDNVEISNDMVELGRKEANR